jgi:hypothetical protein
MAAGLTIVSGGKNSPTYFGSELAFTIFDFEQNLYGCQRDQTVLWRTPKLLQADSGFFNRWE